MGLLDSFSSPDMQLALGLLAAGGAKPVRTSFGEGLLSSVQGAQAYAQRQKEIQAAEEDRKQRQAMQAMQMQQMQQAAAERQKALQQAELDQTLLRSSFSPMQGPTQDGGPLVGKFDPRSMLGQGASMEAVQRGMQLNAALNPEAKLPKLKSVEPMRGPDGKMVNVALFEDGTHKVLPYGVKPEIALHNLGNRAVAIDKNDTAGGTSFDFGISPDALLGAQTTMRGQNMVDARAREKNQIDKAAVGKVEWKQDVNGNWVGLPKEISGQGPVSPVTTTMPGKREQQAQNALGIIDEAAKLIDKGTSSYLGAGVDQAARVFGKATPGAEAAAQLQALEGALMMAQPRMEGPQSDKDVALYRQMAAQIGDSTVPAESKKKALQTIRSLHARYAGQQEQKPEAAKTVVRTGRDASGRKVVQYSDGSIGYGD